MGAQHRRGLRALSDPPERVRLVRAAPRHGDHVRELSARVFARFGDYASWLPSTLSEPGTRGVIAESGDMPVGFALYSLQRAEAGIVELTAIAVAPEWQSRGIGRRLLDRIERTALRVTPRQTHPMLTLTVAEDNVAARGLFERSGYRRVPGSGGRYAEGQRSIDMSRRLARLRVIQGGRGRPTLEAAVRNSPPFPIDALVVEDDTWFVLGAPSGILPPREHPLRLWHEVHEAHAAEPGTVHERGERPIRLHAVVHDVAMDPTWREAWIETAVRAVLERCAERKIVALGLPVLGAVHGRMPVRRFVRLLQRALDRHGGAPPRRLWLFGDESAVRLVRSALDDGRV